MELRQFSRADFQQGARTHIGKTGPPRQEESTMRLQSLCPVNPLEQPDEDYKSALRVEQYRVSPQAIYFGPFFSVQYLPFQSVRRAWVQDSTLSLTGCCGRQLPVTVLRVQYGEHSHEHFVFQRESSALRVLSMIAQCRPDIPLEPEKKS